LLLTSIPAIFIVWFFKFSHHQFRMVTGFPGP